MPTLFGYVLPSICWFIGMRALPESFIAYIYEPGCIDGAYSDVAASGIIDFPACCYGGMLPPARPIIIYCCSRANDWSKLPPGAARVCPAAPSTA